MTTLTDRQRKILDSASEHGGRYLLQRRFGRPTGDTETDADYAACGELVESGYARWLGYGSSMAPGVRLTGKPAE